MLEKIRKEAFKDGDDYIVVFRNCSGPDIERINAELKPLQKNDSYVKPLNKEIKFIEGKYNNLTPMDALAKDGDIALKHFLKNKKDDEMAESVNDAIYQYISFKLSRIENPASMVSSWNIDRCNDFFKQCDILISERDKKALSCGYANYDAFLDFGLLEQKKAAIIEIIERTKEVI